MTGSESRRRPAPWGNPLIERIIATGSRRARHQYVRGGYLAILILATVATMLITTSIGGQVTMRGLAIAGAAVFETASLVLVAGICLLTPIFMAGAIEQEASPRTWDIMLTTPMTSAAIVLGHLLGRLFFVVTLIIATAPILLVLQAFGGTGPAVVASVCLIATCTALVVASAAITLSATRTGGRRAVLGFYAGVIVALITTWTIDSILQPGGVRHTTWVTPLNPFLVLMTVLRGQDIMAVPPTGAGALVRFWYESPVLAHAACTVLLSVLLNAWSIVRVRHLGPVLGRGPGGRTDTRPHRPVGRNAVAWRASRGRPRRRIEDILRWVWVGVGSLGGVVLVACILAGLMPVRLGGTVLSNVLMAEMLIAVMAAITISGSAITREREDGTLDLLLTTPIQPGPYLTGKVIGIVRALMPLLIVPLVTCLAVAIGPSLPGVAVTPGWLPGAVIGGGLSLIPFVAFCVAVGLHWSLRSASTMPAVAISTMICLIVAALVGLCIVPLGSPSPAGGAFLAGLTPFTAVEALPQAAVWSAVDPTITPAGMTWRLIAGSLTAACGWAAFAWMVLSTTRRTFTVTMRRMAGTS